MLFLLPTVTMDCIVFPGENGQRSEFDVVAHDQIHDTFPTKQQTNMPTEAWLLKVEEER